MGGGDPVKSPAQNPNSPTRKSSSKGKANSEDGSECEREVVDVDEVFDVTTLRRLVKMERRKANTAWSDLEKERTAAASSAEETMAMILRLQSEKSSAEIQANQFRRMADERLEYDHEVIEELQWMITQHENQKGLLEDQLAVYREELILYGRDKELNDSDGNGDVDDDGGGSGGVDGDNGDGDGGDCDGCIGDDDGDGDDDDYGDGGGDDYGDGCTDVSGDGGCGDDDGPINDSHSVHSSSETELQTEKQTL